MERPINNTSREVFIKNNPDEQVKDPKCVSLEAFKIYPNDSSTIVKKKQGIEITCKRMWLLNFLILHCTGTQK